MNLLPNGSVVLHFTDSPPADSEVYETFINIS